jgi:Ni2+-binding GTPase involved in maturation of urease and hydrogenase
MRVHFVGGFLGSGKTTAIVNACLFLRERGVRTGIVTNDQGRLQVDALFARSAGLPAVEVSDGCFCCRYDDFDERVAALAERERPDVIFAESVGSCADLVATVIRPFAAFRENYGAPSLLSVFVDSRLLLARLSGRTLPFSEDVLYVFDRQIEEADLLVLNKRDLLKGEERGALRAAVAAVYPDKPCLEYCAADGLEAARWLELLDPTGTPAVRPALAIDYTRYGRGERELAWLDERLIIQDTGGLASDGTRCRAAVLALVRGLARRLDGAAVGHVKFFVSVPGLDAKLGMTASDLLGEGFDPGRDLPPFVARRATVALNARVQTDPATLAAAVAAAINDARRAASVSIAEEDRSAFRPGPPLPLHRLA